MPDSNGHLIYDLTSSKQNAHIHSTIDLPSAAQQMGWKDGFLTRDKQLNDPAWIKLARQYRHNKAYFQIESVFVDTHREKSYGSRWWFRPCWCRKSDQKWFKSDLAVTFLQSLSFWPAIAHPALYVLSFLGRGKWSDWQWLNCMLIAVKLHFLFPLSVVNHMPLVSDPVRDSVSVGHLHARQ